LSIPRTSLGVDVLSVNVFEHDVVECARLIGTIVPHEVRNASAIPKRHAFETNMLDKTPRSGSILISRGQQQDKASRTSTNTPILDCRVLNDNGIRALEFQAALDIVFPIPFEFLREQAAIDCDVLGDARRRGRISSTKHHTLCRSSEITVIKKEPIGSIPTTN